MPATHVPTGLRYPSYRGVQQPPLFRSAMILGIVIIKLSKSLRFGLDIFILRKSRKTELQRHGAFVFLEYWWPSRWALCAYRARRALPIFAPVQLLREGFVGCCVMGWDWKAVQLHIVNLPRFAWSFDLF